MIQDLEITGFRGFELFEMNALGRVNLLVGPNNSGKTTILEAIEMLTSRGHLDGILAATRRRGERIWHDINSGSVPEADVCHLFHGHVLKIGSSFTIATRANDVADSVLAKVVEFRPDYTTFTTITLPVSVTADDGIPRGSTALQLNWMGPSADEVTAQLSRRGGISYAAMARYSSDVEDRQPSPVLRESQFISTSSLDLDRIGAAFEEIVLTPEESLVVQALNLIQPDIERIARIGTQSQHSPSRSGMAAKIAGVPDRVPIGSLGEGIWRMLELTLALVRAKGGILLVDEIDTGLHYTVLGDMWKLVSETAQRLDIQVFATTHSRDACESLATLARNASPSTNDVTIQRIEPGKQRAVAFSAKEIVIAAERGIEVR